MVPLMDDVLLQKKIVISHRNTGVYCGMHAYNEIMNFKLINWCIVA